MKTLKSRLAVILSLMMILTSLEFVGVFAGDEPAADDGAAVAEETVASPDADLTEAQPEEASDLSALADGDTQGDTDPATNPDDPTPTPDPDPEPQPQPPAVPGNVALEVYAGGGYVHFMWAPVADAEGYNISVNGAQGQDIPKGKIEMVNGKCHYRVAAAAGNSGAEIGTAATLTVTAYNKGDAATPVYSTPATLTGYPVRTLAYKLTIKAGGKLKSHGGPSRKITVKKGQVIYAYGFGGGKYIFKDGGSIFYCNKSRTGKRSCVFAKKMNYSRQEAEFFVSDKGLSSKTGHLIWVNGYTQHVFLFNNVGGRWVVADDWECATGKAAAPTPTGVSGVKTVWKKIKSRHGLKWWTSFSDINSFHGKRPKWKVGSPQSKGCIRNPTDKAKLVYGTAGIGTRVFIY